MFGWLFGRKKAIDPPTEKQLAFAMRLGVVVTPAMSKWDVSQAIDAAVASKPSVAKSLEGARRRKLVEGVGTELAGQEDKWNALAERGAYILAAYVKGKETIVDVLSVTGAHVNDRKKLILELDAPKLVKDRHAGDHLEWQKAFELPADKLRYYEEMGTDLDMWGLDSYRIAVERGLKIAKSL